MSGFVAALGPPGSPAEREWVSRACEYLAFRGPDGSHSWHDERSALGYASLVTTPEENGRSQPVSFDGQVWLVADVRLDARDELVDALRAAGRDASLSLPDAELALHAYLAWGEACPERLHGDFALVIWDQRLARLFAARDRFGVSQLFYTQVGESLLVSNTLNALLLHPGVSDALDDRSAGDLLLFSMNLDPARTAFADIHRLPPAHLLIARPDGTAVRRYWRLPEPGGFVHYRKAADYVEHFRTLFARSVSDRLRTDRASLLLSGGMDSPSIAAFARETLEGAGRPYQLHAVTMDVSGLMQDSEPRYARSVADFLGVELELLSADSYELLDASRPPPALTPEPGPFAATAMVRDAAIRSAARARVGLTGLGGDPLFMFIPTYWLSWLARGRFARLAAAFWQHLRLYHRMPELYFRAALHHLRRPKPSGIRIPDWLEPRFVERIGLSRRPAEIIPAAFERVGPFGMTESPVWPAYLSWSDPGFTGLPIRYRHPFFDLRLIEFVRSLPPSPWCPAKQLLRDASRGMLPDAVLQRPKSRLAEDPTLMLTRQRGLPPGALQLVADAQGLDQFVSRDRFAERLRSGHGATRSDNRMFMGVLAFAQWLQYRRRPAVPANGTYPAGSNHRPRQAASVA